jgi:hypothetical protein
MCGADDHLRAVACHVRSADLQAQHSYYQPLTGFNENVYLTNWLLLTAILFGGSGAIYLLRLLLARRTTRSASS